MRVLALFHFCLYIAALLTVGAQAETVASHLDLDWQAPYRWVHIDNVDPHKAQLFETCRHNWLAALKNGDHLRGDGRPLFFCARGESTLTYFTFYPFKSWTEMDERGKMIRQTQAEVGDSTVRAYDAGDEALIPPHGSQIWRRDTSSDISWSGVDSVTDVSFGTGRMERRQVDPYHWDEFNKVWDSVRVVLSSHQYPLACRTYVNVYGGSAGDCILLWLASDSAAFKSAPSIAEALTKASGQERAGGLIASLNKYFPVQNTYEIERRADLSNLGR